MCDWLTIWLQDSKPSIVTALEDCVYNFVWSTAAACPLNISEHGDCKVTNPLTGKFCSEIIILTYNVSRCTYV